MAKSSRASVIKVNRKKLKARVFGPAEDARTKRLSDKLLELASQPKPPKAEMEIENDPKEVESKAKETKHADDTTMDVDGESNEIKPRSRKAEKKHKEEKKAGIMKKRHRKETNSLTFPKKGLRASGRIKKR